MKHFTCRYNKFTDIYSTSSNELEYRISGFQPPSQSQRWVNSWGAANSWLAVEKGGDNTLSSNTREYAVWY